MGITFEGEFEELSVMQLDYIKGILRKRSLDDSSCKIEHLGKKGDNFASSVKRITIEKNNEILQMIIKTASRSKILRKNMCMAALFRNEALMYSEILPDFIAILQSTKSILRIPKCYGYFLTEPEELILLEDMKVENFVLLDKLTSLGSEDMKVVLKDVATFHSLSYVLKEKDLHLFQRYNKRLISLWADKRIDPNFIAYCTQLEDDAIALMENEHYKNCLKTCGSQLTTNALKMYERGQNSKHSVVLHGDCWMNNILFKLQNGKPMQSVMIDYQLSRVGSPADDLLYLLYNCSDLPTRSVHFTEWMDHYYMCLGQSLSNFGLSVEDTYPREELNIDLKLHAKLALGLCLIVANLQVREDNDVFDLNGLGEADILKAMDQHRIINAKGKSLQRLKDKIIGFAETTLELERLY